MTWETRQLEEFHAVRVQCAGQISSDDLLMLAVEVCFLVKEHQYSKVLMDVSPATLSFAPEDLCKLIDVYIDYRLPITTRSAIVLASGTSPQEYAKVLRSCKEHGYSVVLLTGEEWASAWLSTG